MTDLAKRIGDAARSLDADWRPPDLDAAVVAVSKRARHRRRTRIAVTMTVLLMCGAVALVMSRRAPDDYAVVPEPVPSVPLLPAAGPMHLEDGSLVEPLTKSTRVVATAITPDHVAFRLEQGDARFTIVPNPARSFRVTSGQVAFRVLGTRFSLHKQNQQTLLLVESGRVQVTWPGGEASVDAGERGLFPPEDKPVAGVMARDKPARKSKSKSWRRLAERGEFRDAYESMQSRQAPPVADDMEELLQAADVARLSDHPAEAVVFLRRALKLHPHDPRYAITAFMLGRVLLDKLGSPRQAAAAFAATYDSDPDGPIAEDALAREVEAWSRAGQDDKAHDQALFYLKAYPEGRRRRAVTLYGGIH